MLKAAAALLRYASEARRISRPDSDAPSPSSSSPAPRMILAMEKRWCFTLRDLDSRAPAFDHFCSLIDLQGEVTNGGPEDSGEDYFASGPGDLPMTPASGGQGKVDKPPSLPQGQILRGRRICVSSIPKVLQGYDRGQDLELWELTLPTSDPGAGL